MKIGEIVYELGKDFFLSNGGVVNLEGKGIFVEYGWVDEKVGVDYFEGLDLEGKVVYVWLGKLGFWDL